jgi:hypothetical protein
MAIEHTGFALMGPMSKLTIPTGHILLPPDQITQELLDYLEYSGIHDPGDDLDLIIVTDIGNIETKQVLRFNNGNPKHYPKTVLKEECSLWWVIIRFCKLSDDLGEWYRIDFADGPKAVGLFQH